MRGSDTESLVVGIVIVVAIVCLTATQIYKPIPEGWECDDGPVFTGCWRKENGPHLQHGGYGENR